jgi:hypothetical protein
LNEDYRHTEFVPPEVGEEVVLRRISQAVHGEYVGYSHIISSDNDYMSCFCVLLIGGYLIREF